MYFFLKNVWKLQKNSYLCTEFYAFGRDIRACPRVGGRLLTSMERDLRPFVRPVSKGRFRTLLSVVTNLANLKLRTAVMQQKASTWVDFISPCGYHSLYIYNKVYASNGYTLFAYIGWLSLTLSLSFPWESVPWCVYISSLAWAGLTLLILK